MGYSGQTIASPAVAHAARISKSAAFAITAVLMIGGTLIGRFVFQVKSSFDLVMGVIANTKSSWNKVAARREVVPADVHPPAPKTWGEFFYDVGTTGGFFALRCINATVATIIASHNALTGTMSYAAMTGAGLRAYSAVSSVGGEITYNKVIDIVDGQAPPDVGSIPPPPPPIPENYQRRISVSNK
jgi:hypothetical protein